MQPIWKWNYKLETFFQKNTQLKRVEIMCDALFINRDAIINSKIKLNVLSIRFDKLGKLDVICTVLKRLYDTGFYKRLHIEFMYHLSISPAVIDKTATLRGLEKLSGHFKNFNSTTIGGLKELHAYIKLPNAQ